MANLVRKPGQSQYTNLDQQDFTYDSGLQQNGRQEGQRAFRSQSTISGGKRAIYLALACILIPMIGLSAILLGLVYGYQVKRGESSDSPLALTQQSDTDDSAYYVHINSTTFATIASWSSTVAPLLVFAAMSLASFPVARSLKNKSSATTADLPTPYQLSLLLETLTGSAVSMWNLIRYRRWPHKQPLASMLRSAVAILVVASIIGYAVAGIDTWLHLVMETVEIDLVSSEQAGQHSFGRGLNSSTLCTADDFDVSMCTVSLAVTGTFLMGANVAFRTLANLSTIHAVRRAESDGKTLAYLAPANMPLRTDFQASTFAMHTHCTPIGAKCNLRATSGASEPFHCSDAFFGNLPARIINGDSEDSMYSHLSLFTQNAGVVLYRDEGLTKVANASFATHQQNPYYMGVWAYPLGLIATDKMTQDGNIVVPVHGGMTWLLGCTMTAYEMTYSWINGSAIVNNLQLANGSVGSIMNSPVYYGLGRTTLESNAYAASAEEDAEAIAESYAYLYSRTTMSLTSGIMSDRPTILEQHRERVLVARVPKVPLWMLVAFNCVYGILGIVLTFSALSASPGNTNDVRERLSIAGIVAFSFEGSRARRAVESKKEMFAEHFGESSAKVGIERSAYEGWEYTLRNGQKEMT